MSSHTMPPCWGTCEGSPCATCSLSLTSRAIRTETWCPCGRCRDARRRRSEQWHARRTKTGAFQLAEYPHIDELLHALIGGSA